MFFDKKNIFKSIEFISFRDILKYVLYIYVYFNMIVR